MFETSETEKEKQPNSCGVSHTCRLHLIKRFVVLRKKAAITGAARSSPSPSESRVIHRSAWKSHALPRQLSLISSNTHRKLEVSRHFQSGNIVPARRSAYFLFQASLQSRTDPDLLPETFTHKFSPCCQNDHVCFLSRTSSKPVSV